jgi:hypothetical protein
MHRMKLRKSKISKTNCIKIQEVVVGNELIGLPDVSWCMVVVLIPLTCWDML